MATAAVAAPATDLEASRASSSEDEFSVWYYIAYGFSLFVTVGGLFLTFLYPSDHGLLASVVGWCTLVTGAYLLLNADLVVTYFRLCHEVKRFTENNKRFKKSLTEQKDRINLLKKTAKVFDTIDTKFGDTMGKAAEETDELEKEASSSVIQVIKLVAQVKKVGGIVRPNGKLHSLLEDLTNIFCRPFPDIDARIEKMHEGLEACAPWQNGTLETGRFALIMADALFVDKLDDIPKNVKALAEAATMTDALEDNADNF